MCPFFFMHIKECHYFILEKNSFISGKKDLKVLGGSFEGIFGMVELTLIASKERVLKPHGALTVFPWTGSVIHVTMHPAPRTALIRPGNLVRKF
jgi:hypothetical protein